MPIRLLFIFISVIVNAAWLYASDQPKLESIEAPLAHCGEIYAPPFGSPLDAWTRECDNHGVRAYIHRHNGLGFEILDSESEACFVPDEEYKLLDSLIDQVQAKIHYDAAITDPTEWLKQARIISKVISDTLAENGFVLYIPTDTLSDALLNRATTSQRARYIFDCDTGSFIFLSISDSLNAPVSLVDVTLPSGVGHNYVQWNLDDSHSMNWDVNGRAECLTPMNLPAFQGRPMSREQTMGYVLYLRAKMWSKRQVYDRAIADFRSAMRMYPEDPSSYNNFAWMVATKDIPARKRLVDDALNAALKATSIENIANYLDTLACTYALKGNFQQALKFENQALAKAPGNSDFSARLLLFNSSVNCTGQN